MLSSANLMQYIVHVFGYSKQLGEWIYSNIDYTAFD